MVNALNILLKHTRLFTLISYSHEQEENMSTPGVLGEAIHAKVYRSGRF